MSPYRTGKAKRATQVVDGGIVDDLVKQFADKFAFLRELIQNALDADASQIDVQVIDQDQGVRVMVRDDGTGMDPDTLQNKLLVLFQSGKENEKDKIGKFGVGFISVLAFAPEKVVVSTSTGGPLYTLELLSDHTYELFQGAPQSKSGTTVSLHIPEAQMAHEEFATRSERALRRWCRHATVPIHFQAAIGADSRAIRIDEPFSLDTDRVLIEQAWSTQTGKGIVGIPRPGVRPRHAFFNRGLTLFETQEAEGILAHLELKIQDTALEHTLSRDNVKRDAAFYEAVAAAQHVAVNQLPGRIKSELRTVAPSTPYDVLLEASLPFLQRTGVNLRDLPLPLLHTHDRARFLDYRQLPARTTHAPEKNALTAELSKLGYAVLKSSPVVSRLKIPSAKSFASVVIPVAPSGSDAALIDSFTALVSLRRKPTAVRLVEIFGRHQRRLFVTGVSGQSTEVVFDDEMDSDPFRLLLRPAILLNVRRKRMAKIRTYAEGDSQVAGALLARLVLSSAGGLRRDLDEKLTRAAIASVLE